MYVLTIAACALVDEGGGGMQAASKLARQPPTVGNVILSKRLLISFFSVWRANRQQECAEL
jgi:hypothetical protein